MKAITKRAMQGATAATTVAVVAGMTGIAAAPASANGHPQFSASGPLTFTSQAVTSTSASQTETITNLADGDTYSIVFAADAVTLAGANAGDFVIAADTCSGVTLGGQATCTVEVRFAPTAVGDRTANLNFAFTATRGVVDPPSPQDIALTGTATPVIAQGPVAGCVKTPAKLPDSGTRRLTTAGCVTNAGEPVKVGVTGRMRGDVRIYRVIRRANGATFIKTYGVPAKLRVTWSSPASPGFAAYTKTKTYRI
ncbi:MAG: hypothetical protein WA988_09810 [Candidatus Nanopelagicales bacterium]